MGDLLASPMRNLPKMAEKSPPMRDPDGSESAYAKAMLDKEAQDNAAAGAPPVEWAKKPSPMSDVVGSDYGSMLDAFGENMRPGPMIPPSQMSPAQLKRYLEIAAALGAPGGAALSTAIRDRKDSK